jgi:hypothetical protein
VGGAREAPHPPRSPPRSSSMLYDGGHHHGGPRRRGGGGRPGARDGGHARIGGGGRPGFAMVVTTTEARGGTAVEAKHMTAVEQHPPSLTSRRNRQWHRYSLDDGPLLRQPNDDGHGSGHDDDLLPAQRRRRWEYQHSLDLGPMGLGLGSAIFLFSKIHFLSVSNDRYYKSFIFCIVQIVSVLEPIRNIGFQPILQILFVVVIVTISVRALC